MSEKFSGSIWRKIKDGVSLYIAFTPLILLAVAFLTIMLLIWVVIRGTIFCMCWNTAMTRMFGFQKITLFQAYVLAFTIDSLRSGFTRTARSEYAELKNGVFNKSPQEKKAKVVFETLIIVFELVLIVITIWVTIYSWNNILPQLINRELVQIDFKVALCFAYIFNMSLGISKSNDTKSQENKEQKKKKLPKRKLTLVKIDRK